MKLVSTEELINHKILPFNIFSELGEKLFAAGEVLTPGKLLQLKHISVLYRDDEVQEIIPEEKVVKAETVQPNSKPQMPSVIIDENNRKVTIETFDMNPSTILRNKLSVDDIDIMGYKGPVNKRAKIDPQTQLKIKAFYNQMLERMNSRPPLEMLGLFANVRDKIVQDIIFDSSDVFLSSELKLLGEYKRCHALNTAILSGMLAKKMDLPENTIYDIVLAGLLHDIGKDKLPHELTSRTNLSGQEQKELQEHTKIGYRIIKAEMDLPDIIAKVALEHHEHNDGSGYPYGKSGDKIEVSSQIVNVCNYFDNLTSNRTPHKIKNTKEALKVMLCAGTQRFAAKSLYTFVHMFSYNDTVNFEEMIL